MDSLRDDIAWLKADDRYGEGWWWHKVPDGITLFAGLAGLKRADVNMDVLRSAQSELWRVIRDDSDGR